MKPSAAAVVGVVGVVALAAVLAACGGGNARQAAPAAPTTGSAVIRPAPVPAPVGKPLLTLTGAVTNRNDASAVVFDQRTLNAMAIGTTSTYEPFDKTTMTFNGVPTADLLARAGIAPGATKVHLHALDDYEVDLRVADFADRRVLLATKADGAPIPIKKGGPIRLVFPADSTVGKNRDLWIWSIDAITVT
jgi:hypothetical protein